MSLLVLGLSHHNAPLDLLERASADDPAATAFERRALAGSHIHEALVLSTCNRTEVYADTLTFHGAIADLTAAFTASTALSLDTLRPHLHVHYEERAVAHVFAVAAGLESMAVGEGEILGQLRSALARAQAHRHVGPELNSLVQHALRVGKRVHTETGVDSVSSSHVDAGLRRAQELIGDLAGLRVLVVGAGGMGALAATALPTITSAQVSASQIRLVASMTDPFHSHHHPGSHRRQEMSGLSRAAGSGGPGPCRSDRGPGQPCAQGRGSRQPRWDGGVLAIRVVKR